MRRGLFVILSARQSQIPHRPHDHRASETLQDTYVDLLTGEQLQQLQLEESRRQQTLRRIATDVNKPKKDLNRTRSLHVGVLSPPPPLWDASEV